MNHCGKKSVFLYREGRERTFWCPVCEGFIKVDDSGRKWVEYNRAEDAVRLLELGTCEVVP